MPREVSGILEADAIGDFGDSQAGITEEGFCLLQTGGVAVFDGREPERGMEDPAEVRVAEPQRSQQLLDAGSGGDV